VVLVREYFVYDVSNFLVICVCFTVGGRAGSHGGIVMIWGRSFCLGLEFRWSFTLEDMVTGAMPSLEKVLLPSVAIDIR
jgi:hypothetical protein